MTGGRWWLIVGWLLLLVTAWVPVQAVEEVTFGANEVTPQFPEHIEFRLAASSSSDAIVDVRLYYGHIQDPIRTQARPSFTPGQQVQANFTLNTRERYLPPGSEIEYFWEIRQASGARHESARQRFTYIDERYQWRSQSLGLVTLHWYSGSDAFAGDVLDTARRTLERLKQQVGVEPTQPINIYFYGSSAEFAQALPPNSAEWIGGQAYPGLNLVIAGVRPDGGAAREVRRMVPHELSHIVLHQATDNPYNTPPTWLDEGLAVYAQETPDSRFPRMIQDAHRANRLIPLRALNASFPLDPDEALLSYAQSAAVVEFMLQQFGPEKSAALVAIFREGVTYDEAVERSLGVTIEELDARWRASLDAGGLAAGTGTASGPDAAEPFDDASAALATALKTGLLIGAGMSVLLLTSLAVLAWRSVKSRRSARPDEIR